MLNRSPASCGIEGIGAAELARRIADGWISSVEVVQAFIARCELLQPTLNAVVAPRFELALQEAGEADQLRAREELLPPLHGVPITVKDCIDVTGLPTTAGLPSRQHHRATSDAEVVRRLRAAGAIVLGKTNVPQAMLFHECDNPLFGLTPHPEVATRSCGGSSGGEAAIIAAGGSPLGCGTDMGGSIRVPAHFCGIHGFKPTSGRIPIDGILHVMPGMHDIPMVPGPMGKCVEDLSLAFHIMSTPRDAPYPATQTGSLADVAAVTVRGMRIGVWVEDAYFSISPAIARAVSEAARVLEEKGAHVVEFTPPQTKHMLAMYCGILGADGGAGLRRLLEGSEIDPRLQQLLRVSRVPGSMRGPLARWLEWRGHHYQADLLRAIRRLSVDQYWQLCAAVDQYRQGFDAAWQHAEIDLVICAPLALPAFRQGDSVGLVPSAAAAFLPNLLDLPAGVVSTTRVRSEETNGRAVDDDPIVRLAMRTERDSTGLPVGVQVLGRRHDDARVLAVMAALEPPQLPLPM